MGSRKARKTDTNQRKLLIGDDLLIEILSRIPRPVVAIRCKLVCKSWCSLISSPYFITRFKQQHVMHESRYPKRLSGMLANTLRRVSMEENPDDHEFNFRGFNLDYLPKRKNGKIYVLASCNDLVLCRATRKYYLCNPFTMQWVALPPPPSQACIRTGLVCQPYNLGDGWTIDGRFRYRIVRFRTDGEEMYCSKTSEWIRCDDLDRDYLWFESKIAAYNGKLYWVNNGGQYLVTYDPFHRTQTSVRLVKGPNTGETCYGAHCHVGECEGVLRVVRFECRYSVPGHQVQIIFAGISVWELQEEEVIFKEHIVFNQDVRRCFLKDIREVVGLHPMNKDVVFWRSRDNSLVSFNMKTRELKVETKFSDLRNRDPHRYAFTLQLPWWPTLIPSPPPIL